MSRIKSLKRIGAREIRFVDPTFNAHPRFREIINQLATFNREHSVSFFAELNAERLTDSDADLLEAAHFVDVEVGVQSRDVAVLKTIRRPTLLARLDEGIKHLTRRRIKVTVDIMYGLPLQQVTEVQQSVKWGLKLKNANIQCLQTLLLPGTELRDRQREWKIQAQGLPPYAVTHTSTMNPAAFQAIEALIAQNPKLRSDVPTLKFVSRKLELFPEQIHVVNPGTGRLEGSQNRRAYLFSGPDLFARRAQLVRFIQKAIRRWPDNLFQFVLVPQNEEPLDLLDDLTASIRQAPSHLIDRYASVALSNRTASRRLMVQLPKGRVISREWVNEAEAILESVFF